MVEALQTRPAAALWILVTGDDLMWTSPGTRKNVLIVDRGLQSTLI